MIPAEPTKLTRLLNDAAQGDQNASQTVLPLVYEELRQIARHRLTDERRNHTLQATALVHEAYLRLLHDQPIPWAGRARFYAAAAEAMRRILIDHARTRGRVKRGGGAQRLPLSVADLAEECDPADVIALDDAICRLEEMEPRIGQVVRLRFYAGLSVEDAATALEVSPRTVKSDWRFARAWLFKQLHDDGP